MLSVTASVSFELFLNVFQRRLTRGERLHLISVGRLLT